MLKSHLTQLVKWDKIYETHFRILSNSRSGDWMKKLYNLKHFIHLQTTWYFYFANLSTNFWNFVALQIANEFFSLWSRYILSISSHFIFYLLIKIKSFKLNLKYFLSNIFILTFRPNMMRLASEMSGIQKLGIILQNFDLISRHQNRKATYDQTHQF